MRFSPQFLDELRARLPVSEVVGRRVKLKKAGREWKGLSPFQQEKSPSFTVNDQKGFYHDFSSGKHGDIISFLMETEGVGFAEAVERLAAMAGGRRRPARRSTTGWISPRNSSPTRWPRAMAPRRAAISATARFRRRCNCSFA